MAECVLCGATIGRNTRSQEHIFAQWVRDLFPAERDAPQMTYIRKTQMRGGELEVEEWEDTPFNARVKDVCKPCNNEWCDTMDKEAAPVLTPLILGEARTLDAVPQTTAAIWATKTLLLLQRQHKEKRAAIPDSDYRWFREHRWPLPTEQIWFGYYDGTGDWPVPYATYAFDLYDPASGTPPKGPGDETDGHIVAFSVGHALFRLFGHHHESKLSVAPGGPFARQLRQAWPADGGEIEWPPPDPVVGDAGIHALVESIGDASEFRRD